MPVYLRDNTIYTVALRDNVPSAGLLNSLSINDSGFSQLIEVGTFIEAIAFINVETHSGTNPTLDVDIQYGYKDGNNQMHWVDSGDSFTQMTTTDGLFFKKLSANFGKYVRFHFKLGGTDTPTYTLTARLALKA